MATQKPKVEKDPEVVIEQAIGRSEQFLERHGKKMLIILVVVIAAVGGYFAYTNLYVASRAEKASAAMYNAQMSFEVDSFAMALNGVQGPNGFMGFEQISDEFSGTAQANLAYHYAGICHMRMGDFAKALAAFEQFETLKGGVNEVIAAQNTGLMGDCYLETGDVARGVELYAKAASESQTVAVAPTYLQKAAIANCSLGAYAKALEQFTQIRDQYPTSINARDIDKYIAFAQQNL